MLAALRRYAVARSLCPPTTLQRALDRFGFVQADPIRAPARAQDLTLRHRVRGYRAGDLERLYPRLDAEETFFINYGFVSRHVYALMHPRATRLRPWAQVRSKKKAQALLDFVKQKKTVHPREADAHFDHGTVKNWWGGESSATTHLLDQLHYSGQLRVVRRENGIRVYAPALHPPESLTAAERVDALIDIAVAVYAPLPAASLSYTLGRLRYAVPHLRAEVKRGLARARERLSHDGGWYWPANETLDAEVDDEVRLLTPFDPIVWDRRRFELFWGWAYRFEAYTPKAKRKHGYYALPLLYRDEVLGWANVETPFAVSFGWAGRKRAPKRAVEAEVDRLRHFL